MNHPILDGINSPSDLKKLNKSDILALSSEIRDFLVDKVGKSGGHLASNLGVVEMTLAIHTVFDSPRDHIIFDVGHQSYVHKLLTGRMNSFDNLRVPGGLSGFTSRKESVHDCFGAGHSSTSVSAALGFAEADYLSENSAYTVCVMGDGAFTGGMIHEALNNCRSDLPLVIILNENGMSISSNKGSFASYLSRVRLSRGYRSLKRGTKNFLEHIPLIGRPMEKASSFVKKKLKSFVYHTNYFEELGLYYIGTIDGNDYEKVVRALSLAKESGRTCVVHLKTTKGKGYKPAESSPDEYHSVVKSEAPNTYHGVFADEIIRLAKDDDKIVAVTAAMGIGTGLNLFGEKYPKRYYDVGIAEGHALTFSAGLAAGGFKPYFAVYSTFLQRAYDSLLHDVALQNLPVKIMIDRAGLAVGDGATHHGIFDVSIISHIPGMTLLAPVSYDSLSSMTKFASEYETPIAIRYANSGENKELISRFKPISKNNLSRVLINFNENDVPEYLFITYGKIYEKVIEASSILEKSGIKTGIIIVETIKPYDTTAKIISQLISGCRRVVYVEEGIRNGGAAEITRSELINCGIDMSALDYRIAAIDDNFASPNSICDLYDFVGLSSKRIAEKMCN